MLGAIIGDIAGSKYEFNNTFDYDFEMFGEGCDFTDDTICTVAIADAILNGLFLKLHIKLFNQLLCSNQQMFKHIIPFK